jgi:hypothetical protein
MHFHQNNLKISLIFLFNKFYNHNELDSIFFYIFNRIHAYISNILHDGSLMLVHNINDMTDIIYNYLFVVLCIVANLL